MIVDSILESGVAFRVGAGLTLQHDGPAIREDQPVPDQQHTALPKADAIVVLTDYTRALGYGHAHLLDEFNIRLLIADPIEFLKHGLLLEFKPLNMDVLPLYIALMATFPPLLWLLVRSPNSALAISFVIYAVARVFGLESPQLPRGAWYFDPFAWRLLFVIGAWVALDRTGAIGRVAGSRAVLWSAALFLVLGLVVTLAVRLGFADVDRRHLRSERQDQHGTLPDPSLSRAGTARGAVRPAQRAGAEIAVDETGDLVRGTVSRSVLHRDLSLRRRALPYRARVRIDRLPAFRQSGRHRRDDRGRELSDLDHGRSIVLHFPTIEDSVMTDSETDRGSAAATTARFRVEGWIAQAARRRSRTP